MCGRRDGEGGYKKGDIIRQLGVGERGGEREMSEGMCEIEREERNRHTI